MTAEAPAAGGLPASFPAPSGFLDAGFAEAHAVMLCAYIAHYVPDWNQVEDVVQETLTLAWQQRERFRPGAQAGPYLRGIARHLLLKESSRARRFVPLLEEFIEGAWRDEERGSLAQEKEALAFCRRRLSAHLQRLIALRYEENLSCLEVAQRAGVNPSAAKVGLLRAREAVAECVRRRLRDHSVPH
jgi:RNA polymerase sigma-70 factor (ECF subfamily)